MSDIQLSTDSFVDIVANTTGIVIILTMFGMVLARMQVFEVDADKRHLAELDQRIEQLRAEQAGLPAAIAEAEAAISQLSEQIELEKNRNRELAKRVEALRQELQAKAQVLEELERLQGQDAQVLAERLRQAQLELAQQLRKLEPTVQEMVEQHDLAELQEQLQRLLEQEQTEQDRLAASKLELQQRQQQIAELDRLLEQVRSACAELETKVVERLVLPGPQQGRSAGALPLVFECYADDDGIGRVRAVSTRNYQHDGETWIPTVSGEDQQEMAATDSAYRQMVGRDDDFRAKRYLYLVVRPEAYAIYRAARRQAETAGWWVEWDPLEAGDHLVLGTARVR